VRDLNNAVPNCAASTAQYRSSTLDMTINAK
jgi:hypothetical protein